MTRVREWRRLRAVLAAIVIVGGCSTTRAAAPPPTAAPTTVLAATTVAPTTVLAPTTVAATTVAPITVAATTVVPTTVAPTTVAATTVAPITVAPPSLPIWPTPADAVRLPDPDGPAAVGVAASGFADALVFYPALPGTGRGGIRYIRPDWATAAGLDPAQTDRVVSSAQVDATPAPSPTSRPVVILSPGWRSLVALSTTLAEELASHGYVVLATQSDVVLEWSVPSTTDEIRNKRFALLDQALAFVESKALEKLVGPIDVHRIAVGGHSYAASTAFDASLTDRRIAAVIDIDGSARGEVTRTAPNKPSLVLVTVINGAASDPLLGVLAARSPNIVSVGVLNALHCDVMDASLIPSLLGTSVFSTLIGPIGAVGATDASTIVLRFLDTVFGNPAIGRPARLPTGTELVFGLPTATADPFGSMAPASG